MTNTQAEDAVRAASDAFYDALEDMLNGDSEPMAEIWSHRDDVTTMHPIGGRQVGWEAVEGPWTQIAELSEDGAVERSDQLLRISDELAYELTNEHATVTIAGHPLDVEHRATNVYRREDGEWKIVHHHTDPSEEFIAVLEDLEDE